MLCLEPKYTTSIKATPCRLAVILVVLSLSDTEDVDIRTGTTVPLISFLSHGLKVIWRNDPSFSEVDRDICGASLFDGFTDDFGSKFHAIIPLGHPNNNTFCYMSNPVDANLLVCRRGTTQRFGLHCQIRYDVVADQVT